MFVTTIRRLEHAEALDGAVDAVTDAAETTVPPGPVRDALHGKQLGHALHPLLILAPMGCQLAATALDLLGDEDDRPAARKLVGMGLLATPPAAVTGLADFAGLAGRGVGELPGTQAEENRPTRRVGLVHAGANVVTSAVFAVGWLARRAGHHRSGAALSLLGLGGLAVGGYLGGHLAYNHGVGVTRGEGAEVASL